MLTKLPCRLAAVAVAALWLCPAAAAQTTPPPTMDDCDLVPVADAQGFEVETPMGTITIETYSNVAPETVQNFRGYVQRGDYDDTVVHRAVPNFVIQTGGFRFADDKYEAIDTQPEIDNEPCIMNVAGTIAMAKLSGQPNSATSQWFINLVDNPDLDTQNEGFTVFGQVTGQSLDVADDIANLALRPPNDVIPPYYTGAKFPEWGIFQDTPVETAVVLGDYGCFDPDQSGVLLVENPTSAGDFEPNDALDLAFTLVSYAPECDGTPPPGCTGTRRVLELDPTDGSFVADPSAEFGLAEQVVTCAALGDSLASYESRIADVTTQLETRFQFTTYTAVPEPAAGLTALVAATTLAGLRSRRR